MDKLSAVPITWSSAFLQSFCVFLSVLAVGFFIFLCFLAFFSKNDVDGGIGIGLALIYFLVIIGVLAFGLGILSLPLFKYYQLSCWGLFKWIGICVGGGIVLLFVYSLFLELISYF